MKENFARNVPLAGVSIRSVGAALLALLGLAVLMLRVILTRL